MPLSAARVIEYERLRVPPEHLGVLVEPDAARVHACLQDPPGGRGHDVLILDTTLAALRSRLRQRLGLIGPVIATGHQPEFVHPGVLAKTMAACLLAKQCGGQAVFLTVDCDVPHATHVAVPQTTAGGLRRVEVLIPGRDRRQPFEWQPRVPRTGWLQLFASLSAMCEFNDVSLLPVYARAWLTGDDPAPQYCDALDRAEAATLAALGLEGIRRLRMSALSETPEFRALVAHCVLQARPCAEAHNAAQAAYRKRHDVRTTARPVPPLAIGSDTVELPFWVARPGQPRRRLFAAPRGEVVTLLADSHAIGEMKRTELRLIGTHDAPWQIEQAGWHLRPRALVLSAFARLLLADLFIHGVGGARYDEMTEGFVAAFLGAATAGLCCVSATLHLPLPCAGVQAADIAAARRRSRDLRYNPQRHLRGVPEELLRERAELVRRSDELRSRRPRDHTARQLVFQGIRRANEKILETDPWRAAEYDQHVQALETQRQLDCIARDREYFYALHPRGALEQLLHVLRERLRA